MRPKIAIVYNEPEQAVLPFANRETSAIAGVLDAVVAVKQSLEELGYKPLVFPLSPPLEPALKKINLADLLMVFNLFEGFAGKPETEIELALFLAGKKVPYTGNSPTALRISLDKVAAKSLFKGSHVPTPAFCVLSSEELDGFNLKFPVILKPSFSDASHGIYRENVVYNIGELKALLKQQLAFARQPILAEEFIDGREFNAVVLGKEVLPISEISYQLPQGLPRLLTYEAKWDAESEYYKNTAAECPANLPADIEAKVKKLAILACEACGCRGYARVDFREDGDGRLYVLEVNPNPDLSPGAGLALQAKAAGLSYTELIKIIIEQAQK
ncbi:MAG: ATP-grasp domain-containing protein [Dehalococcoidales bacterium]|nr:ATP-grasp domain-containing protein [Dehalococcoidales bacterium]